MKKTAAVAWLILTLLCAVCLLGYVILRSISYNDPLALIYSDGVLVRSVKLSENCEFTVKSDNGYNTIKVVDNSIAVISADCPDKVCINSGAVSSGAVPIICLPHKLEIRIIESSSNVDAVIN